MKLVKIIIILNVLLPIFRDVYYDINRAYFVKFSFLILYTCIYFLKKNLGKYLYKKKQKKSNLKKFLVSKRKLFKK